MKNTDVDTKLLIEEAELAFNHGKLSWKTFDALTKRLAAAENTAEIVTAENEKLRQANHNLMRINGGLRGREEGVEDDHWCAVEGCQNEPTMYEFDSDEFVCDQHVYYGAENPLQAPLDAAEARAEFQYEMGKEWRLRALAAEAQRKTLVKAGMRALAHADASGLTQTYWVRDLRAALAAATAEEKT